MAEHDNIQQLNIFSMRLIYGWMFFLSSLCIALAWLWHHATRLVADLSPCGLLLLGGGLYWIVLSGITGDRFRRVKARVRVFSLLKLLFGVGVSMAFPLAILAMLYPQSHESLIATDVALFSFCCFVIGAGALFKGWAYPLQVLLLLGGYWMYFMLFQVDYTISGTAANSTALHWLADFSVFAYTGIQTNLPAMWLLAGVLLFFGAGMLLISRAAD